jgi:hypothetical protein
MLAHVEAVKAEAVIELCEREPLLVLLRERQAGAVVLIEDTELHDAHPFESGAMGTAAANRRSAHAAGTDCPRDRRMSRRGRARPCRGWQGAFH